MTEKRNPDPAAEETDKLPVQPVLPEMPVPQTDIPEEGFIPFSQEFGAQKQKRKRVLLLLLLGLAVLLGLFLLLSRTCSYYQRIMRHLQFDYRTGETINEELSAELGACANAAAAEISGKDIHLQANVYVFNSQSDISLNADRYDYTRSAAGNAELRVRSAASGSLFYKNARFEADADRNVWKISGGKREPSDDPEAALLYDYLFTAAETDRVSAVCYDSYYTTVGTERYVCEIWLMTVPLNGQDTFFTLYRYYQDNTLRAVRCLTSNSDLMFVYDITEYTLQ